MQDNLNKSKTLILETCILNKLWFNKFKLINLTTTCFEEFEDAFYDTKDLSLINQNFFLKQRSFKPFDNLKKSPEWYLLVNNKPITHEEEILEKLKELVPKHYQLDKIRFKGCDKIIGNFDLNFMYSIHKKPTNLEK